MDAAVGLNTVLARILELHPASALGSHTLVHASSRVPAGRGLVFRQDVVPEQTLLAISGDAMINVKSYSEHFHPDILPPARSLLGSLAPANGVALSSSQGLSLLLARTVTASRFQVARKDDVKTEILHLFVQTLPASFETLPLSWLACAPDDGNDPVQQSKQQFFKSLSRGLPQHSQKLLQKVLARFERDWNRIQELRASDADKLANPPALSVTPKQERAIVAALDRSTFLWAWCCVNTRCVFLPLGLADHADNFTLVPVLDMANHTSDIALECKVKYTAGGGITLHAPAATSRSNSVLNQGLRTGDECFITYGPHSNESLLSEYGFILPGRLDFVQSSTDSEWTGNQYVDVLVDAEVQSMLEEQGSEGLRKIELLQDRGYWGDLTLHPYPGQAHPSHRLVPALRLLSLCLPPDILLHPTNMSKAAKRTKAGANNDMHLAQAKLALSKWEATLTGYEDRVSLENERQAHLMLLLLCQRRLQATREARQHAEQAQRILQAELAASVEDSDRLGYEVSLSMVKQLLDEEEQVLTLVMRAAELQAEW